MPKRAEEAPEERRDRIDRITSQIRADNKRFLEEERRRLWERDGERQGLPSA